MTTCDRCDRPVADQAHACTGCTARAAGQLRTIAQVTPAARAVAHGHTSRGPAAAGGGFASRVPLDLHAAARLDTVTGALGTWARHIAAERGIARPAGPDLVAGWLLGHLEWVRHRGEVVELYDDVDHAARVVVAIADGPAPGRYAGPCDTVDPDTGRACGADVTARPGAGVAVCRQCGARYEVAARQAWMRAQVEDRLARPVEIAGVLLTLGVPVGYSTVARYAARGLIAAHGHDSDGRPLFRIGDVLDVRLSVSRRGGSLNQS